MKIGGGIFMRKYFKKAATGIMATTIVLPMVLGGCGKQTSISPSEETGTQKASGESTSSAGSTAVADDVEKPEKIKIMVDGTFNATKANGQAEWIAKFKELTGIEIEVTQPDHDAYYDVLGQTFASGVENWPDVVILSSSYYTGYAEEGALWDMTEAWNDSDMKNSGRISDTSPIEGNMINGKLYGFSKERGNGCITYVKKKWLDNCNWEVPTNYEEYLNMLDAFTTGDPDGNGVNGDTYGVSAAGLIGTEAPYVNYLPEFYQDAYPSFYQKEDGTWVDGFTEDSMKEAIERLRDAYNKGYIDKETLTNGTKDCRNKFYEDKFGVFTYWAGTWNSNLKEQLEANGLDGELVALPPIEEVGQYFERTAPVYAITSACENPEGVFKYFIESMADGGELEELWCYGVEGTHWSTKAETVCGNTYKEGEFHMLENKELPGTQFTKINIDPLLAVAEFTDGNPGEAQIKDEAKAAQEVFNKNSKMAPLPVSTDVMSQYNGDLTTLKNSIIANCIVQGASIEDEFARFDKEHGTEWSKAIVDSLNNVK